MSAAGDDRAEPAALVDLDLIACDGCGRTFATEDGPGMIAAIVGPCPDCGGRFQLDRSAAERATWVGAGGPGARRPPRVTPT